MPEDVRLAQPLVSATSSVSDFVHRYRWVILAGLITAAIMEILDTTIINVALPQMAGNLGATTQEIAWVSTSYILANVVVLPLTAFFTRMFGRRRYLTGSIILFVAASFLCGTSSSLGEIILWRLVQGAGGAALLSTAQATLRQIFPQRELTLVQAIFLLGIIVAPTLGPTLGGWITDNYQWNWCFWINVPVGIVSAFLVFTFLQDPVEEQRRPAPVDWWGIGLLICGAGALQYILEEGNADGWFERDVIIRLSVASPVALAALGWWQLSPRNRHPVIELRILKKRELAASICLFVILGFGLFGGAFLFPLFTQTLLGFTPTESGVAMMPGGFMTAGATMLCGVLLSGERPRVDARVLIACGVCLMVWAMWRLGHLTTAAGEVDARTALMFRGAALGLLFAPINNVAFASLEPHEAQQASGLINLSRQLGGSFGIATLGTYVTRQMQRHRADLITKVVVGTPALDERYRALVGGLVAKGSAALTAQRQGLAILDQQVMRQAAMLAYNDAWLLILIAFLCGTPAVFLLRRRRSGQLTNIALD